MADLIKVAAVQFDPKIGEIEENRRTIAEKIVYAAEEGAKLIVFPEMAVSGYVWESRKEISPYVESVPGETTNRLSALAAKYGCYVVVGVPEVDPTTNVYYNSAVLIGPQGVVGCYRKTHLFAADARWAREGKEEIPVFETEIGRIAMLICMDAMYFEPSRMAALKKADILAFPTNWVGKGINPPSKTWRLRAKENGFYWIASNRSGTERGAQFTGGTGVISPSGEVIDELVSGEGIVFSEIDLSLNQTEKLLKMRNPKAYQDILLNPYLWKEGETRLITDPVEFDLVSISAQHPIEHLQYIIRTIPFNTLNRLVVLPEITQEITNRPSKNERETLMKISAKYNIHIAASIRKGSNLSGFIIQPDGTLSENIEVHSDGSKNLDEPHFLTVILPFGRVGLLIGGDAQLPESYRALAKQGADIIIVSLGNDGETELWMQRIWAFENDAVLAAAAHSAEQSMLFLHSQVTNEESNSAFLHQTLTPEMTNKVRNRPFLRRLNHHLYDSIAIDPSHILLEKAGATQ
ncbi:nitrilase-related carbon-nitrogen hydrolase [Peribacillus frigoritolerans]|uniref:nitrilase-related carbon-nitrogen hydrolase n=1 Tax=Peribacillus frigoritolerans TaxID=450367 RepID=UPI002EA43FF5|nr:nitrilase-related carbon-nitrogen hydrolase [Peribacillus frigoritolerans]